MRSKYFILFVLGIILLTVSCTSSRPSYVLSSGDMEDVLYDMHKAHFIQDVSSHRMDGTMQYALLLHVLKQHDVTQAEWDSSLVYYSRNCDELEEIYANLMDRLNYEAAAIGAGTGEVADSTNIWNGDRNMMLMADEMNVSFQWKLDADTLLEPGEKVTLHFKAMYLNRNVQSRATAMIVMRLGNDSLVVRQTVVSNSSKYEVSITDDNELGIKSISGLFMLHPSSSSIPVPGETITRGVANQVLSLMDISLSHESMKKPDKIEEINADSLNTDALEPQKPQRPDPLLEQEMPLPDPGVRERIVRKDADNKPNPSVSSSVTRDKTVRKEIDAKPRTKVSTSTTHEKTVRKDVGTKPRASGPLLIPAAMRKQGSPKK